MLSFPPRPVSIPLHLAHNPLLPTLSSTLRAVHLWRDKWTALSGPGEGICCPLTPHQRLLSPHSPAGPQRATNPGFYGSLNLKPKSYTMRASVLNGGGVEAGEVGLMVYGLWFKVEGHRGGVNGLRFMVQG